MELVRSKPMKEIKLTYHREDGVWWVDTDDLPGFYAAADTLEEARKEAKEGLAFALGDKDFRTIDSFGSDVQIPQTQGGSLKNGSTIANDARGFKPYVFSYGSNASTQLPAELINSISNLNQSPTLGKQFTYSSGSMKALA